ncbi:MAG TPA: hypothetical protein VG713_09630 [Pirellulales bacterium]|nr:hypothetical protein [Pirellulales bacterium]
MRRQLAGSDKLHHRGGFDMIHSVPGAGDILGDPQPDSSRHLSHGTRTSNSAGQVSPDAFDPPAASGLRPNPKHLLADNADAHRHSLVHEAWQFAEHAGGIEQAIELLHSLHGAQR